MAIKSWLILLGSFLVLQSQAKAEALVTTVFNVYESAATETILVLSGIDGRIYRSPKNEKNLKALKALKDQVVEIDFTVLNGKNMINSINPTTADTRTMDLNFFQYNQLREFAPTDLQTFDKANHVFKNMINDGDKKRSQCFKRAHMWSYDMWSNLGINSQKIFIFFTRRFIELDKTDWWFHVAPMVTAGGEDYVMDGTFMQKPTPIKQWNSYFMMSEKISCPQIEKYQEYSEHQWSRLCYYMKVPMHYFTPADIEKRDLKGVERNHWVLEELQDARRAFKNYDQVYQGLDTGKRTITY